MQDGHASTVLVHPSSGLFSQQDELEWVIFHEVVWTSKPFMRTVCPIKYSWVKDLLPKLHEVDIYALSGTGRQSSDGARTSAMATGIEMATDEATEATRRNTDADVSAARQRFLARKQARGKK